MALRLLGLGCESLQVGGDRVAKLRRQLPEGRTKKPAYQTLHRFQYLLYHEIPPNQRSANGGIGTIGTLKVEVVIYLLRRTR